MVSLAIYDYTAPGDALASRRAYKNWINADAVSGRQPFVSLDVDAANKLLDDGGYAKDGDSARLPDGKEMSYKINVVSGWSDWVQVCPDRCPERQGHRHQDRGRSARLTHRGSRM